MCPSSTPLPGGGFLRVDPTNHHCTQISRERDIERCPECGSVYKMDYVGPQDDHHHDHHHGPEIEEPKTFADFVKPEYRYL